MTSTFLPSPNQLAILSHVSDPTTGNLLVEAVAGSGKSTTIFWVIAQIPTRRNLDDILTQSIVFIAFSKNIVEYAKTKLPPHVQVVTCHSLGLRAFKTINPKVKVDARKCARWVYDRLGRDNPDVLSVLRLIGLLKSLKPFVDEAEGRSNIKTLISHHNLSFEDSRLATQVALDVLSRSDADLDVIDFDDMLRLPVLLNALFEPKDWVFVDESQDLNEIQREILLRLQKDRGDFYNLTDPPSPREATRFIFVGDPRQAIYAFRGASHDSLDLLSSAFACKTLPLDICYRCSKAVVAEAQKQWR